MSNISRYSDPTVEDIGQELQEYKKYKRFLSVKEVSNFFGVNEKTVRKWIHYGYLHAIKTDRGWLITRQSIIQFVKEKSNFSQN